MSEDEAREWIRQVRGSLYHNGQDPEGENAWVALVRAPAAAGRAGKLILAFGPTLTHAAEAAECEWQRLWQGFGPTH